jgi:predicted TPR repeat methyltransferase
MSDADAMLRDAVALHQSGRLDDARWIYETILRLDERNPNALNLLGMVHHHQGRHEHAAELIARAIDAAPSVPGFHNNLGTVRLAQRRSVDAEAALRRAIELQADFVEAINNLAVALMGQGRFDESMPLLARCLELRPVYPSARNNLGNALRAKRMYRQAVACYSDAITQQQDHVESWSNLAIALFEMRDLKSAETAAKRAISLRADCVSAYHTLGLALEAQKRTNEAIALFQHVLQLCPSAEPVRFHLASLTGDQSYNTVPPDFVRGLFDQYADMFERHLVEVLKYRAPQLLHEAVRNALDGSAQASLDIGDLGCGTGLCGPLFKSIARTLVGVDLSARMIHEARQRKVYDELLVEELTHFLTNRSDRFDLLIAADVLLYFGDLSSVLRAAQQALRGGGFLAFTLEKQDDNLDGAGYRLHPTRRFTHTIGYVRSSLQIAGLTEISTAEATLRTNSGQDVPGWVIVAQRPPHQ